MLRTNVSWIELVFTSGARKPLTASMDHASMGRMNLGGVKMHPLAGVKGFICNPGRLVGGSVPCQQYPKNGPMNQ